MVYGIGSRYLIAGIGGGLLVGAFLVGGEASIFGCRETKLSEAALQRS